MNCFLVMRHAFISYQDYHMWWGECRHVCSSLRSQRVKCAVWHAGIQSGSRGMLFASGKRNHGSVHSGEGEEHLHLAQCVTLQRHIKDPEPPRYDT